MKKLLFVAAIVCSFATLAFGQTKLIEKIKEQPGKLIIPYEKYELANGLTLIIHEDHSDPIVHLDVTYHVGSAREEIGKSGFAHFFEHMMFQGSENVADEEHFKIVTESGGTLNGTTNRDRTNYFETVPSNQLETVLWLEADRMGFLLDAVTQRKFEVQRSTVKNERGQNYDNRPYGLVGETTSRNLYPYGHPYSWLTIGYVEDLDRVDVNDLKRFFMRWYGPNNATVTVGGDVDPQEVVKLVEKYFGSIPRGPEVENMQPMIPSLALDRYVTLEDKIRSPMVQMTFPAPERYHPDLPAIDALMEIIGGPDYSIMYNKFVKSGKATSAYAYMYESELASEIIFAVRAYPETNLGELEKEIRQAFKDFEARGVTDEDLARFKAQWEYNFINNLTSVYRKVYNLASYQTFAGNPNYFQTELNRYLSVTKEDIMRVYKKYVQHENCVILSVIPEGEYELEARATNYMVNHHDYKAPKDEYAGLTYRKPVDNFDRSVQPAPGANPVIKVPEYWTAKMDNGAKIIGTQSDELPMSMVQISIEGGQLMEAKMTDKAGVSSLLAQMLNESTRNKTKEEFEKELAHLGGNIWINSGREGITITVMALDKDLDAVLKLAEERLFEPAFDEEDFDRVKKRHIEGVRQADLRPSSVSRKIFNKLLYADGDIRQYPSGGTVQTVENTELSDVIAFYNQALSGNLISVVAVGGADQQATLDKLRFLNRMKNKNVEVPPVMKPVEVAKGKIYLVNKDNAPHTEIRMGYPSIGYDATGEYYKMYLMNYPLGGMFNSRINLNLREDKGYTYGARSGFSGGRYDGSYAASASVRVEATDSAMTEFLKEIRNYKENGVTPEEVAFMKQSIGQSEARQYESMWQKGSFLNRILTYDLPADYVQEREKILQGLTPEQVNKLAQVHLQPEKMNMLVVGDKEKILPGLQKLGFEIVELDLEGNVMGETGTEAGK